MQGTRKTVYLIIFANKLRLSMIINTVNQGHISLYTLDFVDLNYTLYLSVLWLIFIYIEV